jgi:intracellular multiplication protein IcmD
MTLLKRVVKLRWSDFLLILSLLIVTGFAFAQDPGTGSPPGTVGSLADNVTKSFQSIGKLMIAAAYVGGFGLTVAAIFKFKQHKDNPTQIPIGTPIALLVIGIILVFLPGLFETTGTTVFGEGKTLGGFEGEGVSKIGEGGKK